MLEQRLSKLPVLNNQQQAKRRLVADLPANVQLDAINKILTQNIKVHPQIDAFVRQSAAKGMTPEQIRQAFITEQKTSANPLILI